MRALEARIAGAAADVARSRRWRAPVLAALVALFAGLPGVLALPPLDRDESRFAQATAQMLETGDYVNIRFQDQPRDKKPVGIHWLQAASVQMTSSVEKREIWAYRLPSLLGAMVAAAACAWGAAAFAGWRGGFAAGAVLGAGFILSTEASIAKTDAVLCAAVTLSMAALGRLYGASRGVIPDQGRWTKAMLWIGLAVGILVKGPIGPMVMLLTLLALWAADRSLGWARNLGWSWGLVFIAAVVGPWAMAITVATDGGFWGAALSGDLAPKLAGGQESHGAPPGVHLLLSPLLSFPASLLIPAALVAGWRGRKLPGVRFALAWLGPSWLVFELMPTKLPHYTLPLYGALAWLMAAAMMEPIGRWSRWAGAALALVCGIAVAAVALVAVSKYGGTGAPAWALAVAVLAITAGAAGAMGLILDAPVAALAVSLALGIGAHGALAGGLAPRLDALWPSRATAAMLDRDGLDPRNGITPGPVVVTGYAEPSLVFALGTETQLDTPAEAAVAINEGRPVLVEQRQDAAFRAAATAAHAKATLVEAVKGLDYSSGKQVTVSLWRPTNPPPREAETATP